MNNEVVSILKEEKKRLDDIIRMHGDFLTELSKPARSESIIKDSNDIEHTLSNIDINKFTKEQLEHYMKESERYKMHLARRAVFDTYVKSLVPKETIESYNTYIEPLDNFKDMTIECNNIDLDENGNFTNSSIKVGPINVKSPQKMTFDEYANLYTNSLNELLINTLKNENSDEKEVIQELQNACEEVYLQDKKKNTIVK